MINDLTNILMDQITSAQWILGFATLVIHLAFAGGVAKDAGNLHKIGQPPCLVPGITWAFATLLGGPFIAVSYWLLHHSNLTRSVRYNPSLTNEKL